MDMTGSGGKRELAVGWAAVAVCTAAAIVAGIVESFLVPLYVGTVLIPLAPVLAVATNVAFPLLGRRAVGRLAGGALPFVGWLLLVIALSGVPRPEGDVVYPGGKGFKPWVSYGVVLGGGFAGAVTLVMSGPAPERRRREPRGRLSR